jgi:hypothetical protein
MDNFVPSEVTDQDFEDSRFHLKMYQTILLMTLQQPVNLDFSWFVKSMTLFLFHSTTRTQ